MDATLIRAALVPAFMRLAGEADRRAPRPMSRIYARWGFSDADPAAEVEVEVAELERVR